MCNLKLLTQSLEETNDILVVLSFVTQCSSNPRDGETLYICKTTI